MRTLRCLRRQALRQALHYPRLQLLRLQDAGAQVKWFDTPVGECVGTVLLIALWVVFYILM